jgi:predicted DNA-binding transcriptional regulator AlpA
MRTQRTDREIPITQTSSTTRSEASNLPVSGTFMRREEVLAETCVCLSTLYNWIASGGFPAPVSLGPRRSNGYSGRAVWVRAEVEQWAQDKATRNGASRAVAARCEQVSA